MFEALKKYAVFSGRARRKEFWLFMLLYFIAMVVAGLFDDLVVGERVAFDPTMGVFSWIVFLGLLIPSTAVSVRRLHDKNLRGWWFLLFLIPLIGTIALFILYCMRGTDGENRFGADPLAGVR